MAQLNHFPGQAKLGEVPTAVVLSSHFLAQELALSGANTEIEHRSETSLGFCLKTLLSSVYAQQ